MENGFGPKCAWSIACRDVVAAEEMVCRRWGGLKAEILATGGLHHGFNGKAKRYCSKKSIIHNQIIMRHVHRVLEPEISIDDMLIVVILNSYLFTEAACHREPFL